MDIETLIIDGVPIAHLGGAGAPIAGAAQALDLIMDVKYAAGADRVAIDKRAMPEEFFIQGIPVMLPYMQPQPGAAALPDCGRRINILRRTVPVKIRVMMAHHPPAAIHFPGTFFTAFLHFMEQFKQWTVQR